MKDALEASVGMAYGEVGSWRGGGVNILNAMEEEGRAESVRTSPSPPARG